MLHAPVPDFDSDSESKSIKNWGFGCSQNKSVKWETLVSALCAESPYEKGKF